MSDNSYTAGRTSSGFSVEAGEHVASSKADKALKWFLCIIMVILVGEVVWLFLINPRMPLFSQVEISGFQGLDREFVLARAGIDERASYISVDPRTVESALMTLPQIESARVIKRFPSSVMINLTERKPLAVSLVYAGEQPMLAIFDKQGVVFGTARPEASGTASLPLITGLFPGEIHLGSQTEPQYFSFLSNMERIHSSAPQLFTTISEIRINRKPSGGFDLSLYPVHQRIKVLTAPDLDENTLRYILLMVDVLSSREPRIGEIDFRAGIASYTVKEASSG